MENEEPLFGDVSTNESVKVVRKLRKKLRQIERLEKTERGLTDEEKLKVSLSLKAYPWQVTFEWLWVQLWRQCAVLFVRLS